MARIAIVGAVGSGKTSLALALAARLHVPHVELDALRYGAQWRERPPAERARRATVTLSLSHWVVDGHDEALRDALWLNADLLVWLDYPLGTSLGRLLRRTVSRLWSSRDLAGGASEHWCRALGRRSVVWWALRSHHRRRAQLQTLLRQPRYRHLQVIRLRRPAPTSELLDQVMDAVTRLET